MAVGAAAPTAHGEGDLVSVTLADDDLSLSFNHASGREERRADWSHSQVVSHALQRKLSSPALASTPPIAAAPHPDSSHGGGCPVSVTLGYATPSTGWAKPGGAFQVGGPGLALPWAATVALGTLHGSFVCSSMFHIADCGQLLFPLPLRLHCAVLPTCPSRHGTSPLDSLGC